MTRLRNYFDRTPANQQSSAAIAVLAALDHIEQQSPAIASSIEQELVDQRSHLKLIASENYSSLAVQLAMGNWMTDKYSEGYPFHRFYAGCDNVDAVEAEAVELAKKLFGAEHAYVQPHSGADANLVALWAARLTRVQNPEVERLGAKSIDALSAEEYEKLRQLLVNQKIMGMSLNAGGHLTHGYRHNVSAKMFHAVNYDVHPKTELLDYDQLAAQVLAERPTVLMAGYSAYPRRLNFERLRAIADSVGAVLLVDMAHFAGLVAGKVFTGVNNPVPYAHIVTSTTHKTLRGPRGGIVLCTEEFREAIDKGCPLVLGGPLPHVMAAKAVAFREALQPEYQSYAQRVVENAAALARGFQQRGARVTTSGTENHLVIVDVSGFGLTGRQAELALREARM
ncbi:MAG: aminotransferase class I/II-fold pyridoxal phosphate-dependent enzyme, partial [Chlamydiia bacterium]|nr:aminotransferase class I/II-fold pyridoxal phosphate-dependent enzyme [Chlamydiia bacterium]